MGNAGSGNGGSAGKSRSILGIFSDGILGNASDGIGSAGNGSGGKLGRSRSIAGSLSVGIFGSASDGTGSANGGSEKLQLNS